MKLLILLITINLTLPSVYPESSNETHFIATNEFQEIKPGQKVPQGLHYRMNLQTGYKEAKILVEENDKTGMQAVPQANQDDESSDVVVEHSRQRLKEALKDIPANIFDEHTEEEWKEISKKYKSYKELKEDLKELELGMKSENEIMNELVGRLSDEKSTIEDKLIILEDIEYLVHSLDNALHFVSIGGLEKVIVPFFNHTNVKIRAECFKIVGTVLQNNNEAKRYASEKTNIGENLLENLVSSLASEVIKTHHEAIGSLLFAFGSFSRNNFHLTLDYYKKGLGILMQIIASDNSKFPLSLKTKALVLIADIIRDPKLKSDLEAYINGSEVCNQLDKFFSLNRNGLVADVDATTKFLASIFDIQDVCRATWSDLASFRHTLIVLLSHHRVSLAESDEDLRDVFADIVDQLDRLNQHLYGHLTIKDDDLTDQYEKIKTEFKLLSWATPDHRT